MQLCSSVATQWTFQLSSGIAALADVAESAGETVFCGNYVLHLDRNEAGLYREGFTHTLPPAPDWCVLLQMRTPNPHSVIGPKSTILIGQNGATWSGQ